MKKKVLTPSDVAGSNEPTIISEELVDRYWRSPARRLVAEELDQLDDPIVEEIAPKIKRAIRKMRDQFKGKGHR